jgi:predicted kinase
MPILYMLVGVPGVGKSTWVKQQDWADDQVAIVSTDNIVEQYAEQEGRTYNEVFKEFMPTAVRLMASQVEQARDQGLNIIWDQTSTTKASRAKKLRMLPEYHAIAIVFLTPDRSELDVRLSGRPGKHIPKNVVDSMIAGFEMPDEEEFDEIWFV